MTYDDLVQQILDMSSENDDPLFVANVPVFVQNAEKRIFQAVKVPNFRKNATSTLTSGNKYLTTPTDYLSPWELAIVVDGEYQYPLLKDVSYIRSMYPNPNDTTAPKAYAQFDENTLLLGPTPDSDYVVELHYFYYPESIVTASTTWLGTNFPNLLLYGSMVEAATFMKSEEDTIKSYAEQYSVNLKLFQDYAKGRFVSGGYRN